MALRDPDLTPTDLAVLAGWASWSDWAGRLNPGGSLRAVARRAHVSHTTVIRTLAKLRSRGLLVGNRLRVELLRPVSPHARSHVRQDLQAATNRALRRCSQRPRQSQRGTYVPQDSVSSRRPKDLSRDPPLLGAQKRTGQNRRRKGGGRPLSGSPVRARVPEWLEFEALVAESGWVGPTLDEVRGLARRVGWRPAVAAALEVDWRTQTGDQPRYRNALTRTIGHCYANRCPSPTLHHGECGPLGRRLHTARRADDLNHRWRVIEAKRRHQPPAPIALQPMPTPQHRADPRTELLRQAQTNLAAGTTTTADVRHLMRDLGVDQLLHTTRRSRSLNP